MAPPALTEGKIQIGFILLAPKASSSMNFMTVQAESKGVVSKINPSLSIGIKKYFRRSHMIPIPNISAVLRGLENDNQIFFGWKCAGHYSARFIRASEAWV